MSTTQAAASNPFVLMVNPEVVFAAIENSDRLARLASRICRPLDKPAPVLAGQARQSVGIFDGGKHHLRVDHQHERVRGGGLGGCHVGTP